MEDPFECHYSYINRFATMFATTVFRLTVDDRREVLEGGDGGEVAPGARVLAEGVGNGLKMMHS